MRKVMELPGDWELHANDQRHPFFVHAKDGSVVEPKAFATDGHAVEVYRALKLEEDKRGRLHRGIEWESNWITIWSARVVLGDFINRNTAGVANTEEAQAKAAAADALFNKDIEDAVRREQEERARLWTPNV